MKICSICGELKNIKKFYKFKKRGKKVRESLCKECKSKHGKEKYIPHPKLSKILPGKLKECSVCNEVKPIEQFYKRKNRPIGVVSECKKCCTRRVESYYKENKDTILEKCKEWRQNHREIVNRQKRVYFSNKMKTDIQFRLKQLLRDRLKKAIKNNAKKGSAVRDLGCSISKLKSYFEYLFLDGMSWDNHGYGSDKWNIDHIKPLSKFDLTDRKQLLKACHYTNLQPLWQHDNFMKGANNG